MMTQMGWMQMEMDGVAKFGRRRVRKKLGATVMISHSRTDLHESEIVGGIHR